MATVECNFDDSIFGVKVKEEPMSDNESDSNEQTIEPTHDKPGINMVTQVNHAICQVKNEHHNSPDNTHGLDSHNDDHHPGNPGTHSVESHMTENSSNDVPMPVIKTECSDDEMPYVTEAVSDGDDDVPFKVVESLSDVDEFPLDLSLDSSKDVVNSKYLQTGKCVITYKILGGKCDITCVN